MKVAFLGVRWLPWWLAIGKNNANPLLQIGPAGIITRIFRKRTRSLGRIKMVDLRRSRMGLLLTIEFHGTALTFSANVNDLTVARAAINRLEPAVPLGNGARQFLLDSVR